MDDDDDDNVENLETLRQLLSMSRNTFVDIMDNSRLTSSIEEKNTSDGTDSVISVETHCGEDCGFDEMSSVEDDFYS